MAVRIELVSIEQSSYLKNFLKLRQYVPAFFLDYIMYLVYNAKQDHKYFIFSVPGLRQFQTLLLDFFITKTFLKQNTFVLLKFYYTSSNCARNLLSSSYHYPHFTLIATFKQISTELSRINA